MVQIRQEEPGFITIDVSDEPSFDFALHGVDLASGLFVSEIKGSCITVEDNGKPDSVISYVEEVLTDFGFETNLDDALSRALELGRKEESLVLSIRSGRAPQTPFRNPAEYGITRKLLPHQLKAVKHALKVGHPANFSVPGSGKTTVALCVYAVLRRLRKVKRLLVIGPASSFIPWEDEFRLTMGRKARSRRLVGSKSKRAEMMGTLGGVDLLLCTYQMAYREYDSLLRVLRRDKYFVVLDEAHHIKNIEFGAWAQTVLGLAPLAERRMILTGTPAPHSLRDLWTQFTYLWPTNALLGTRTQFDQKLGSPSNGPTELKRDLAPFFIRVKKSDLKLSQPISTFYSIPTKDVPKSQRLIIRLLELKTLREVKQLNLAETDMKSLRRWRRARTIRLLQAASNPALLTTRNFDLGDSGESLDSDSDIAPLLKDSLSVETPAKIQFVVDLVRKLVAQNKKVVVWASFIGNLHALQSLLQDLHPLLIYGDIPAYEENVDSGLENREGNIHDFKTRKDRPILLANPAACAESISLHTVCWNAVYLERTFNCAQFLQSMDRIHRVGMRRNTRPHYHIPLLGCTIEHILDRRLKARQKAMYEFLDEDMPIMGFEDESLLLEREEDLEGLFNDLIKEIKKNHKRTSSGPNRGRRTSR